MADRSTVSLINGPVGSGKTTTALMKAIRLAAAQAPSRTRTAVGPKGTRMPVREFRLAVVRDTYRQLWRTTIPSWFSRVPRDAGEFTGAEGAPAVHRIPFALPDGTMVEFQADFVAIGDLTAEDALRGYEVTGFYLNELDLLPREVFEYARTRTGRFPPAADVPATWHGIIGDLNAPVLSNWTYERFFLATPEELAAQGAALFRQPSGLSPQAENRANLVPGYYENISRGGDEAFRRRMVENIPGYDRSGKPVYPEFHDQTHVASERLAPLQGMPLVIGLDAGGHPAAVITQHTPSGVWRVLRELVGDAGTGPTRFGQTLARLLADEFPGYEAIGWADPSAAYGADRAAGEQDWIEIVAAQTGLTIRAAPTNSPEARWEAVRLPLGRLIDGKPGLVLCPSCKVLRAGFNAEYRFRRQRGSEQFDDRAEKNGASHPHDALQYACSGGGEDRHIRERRADDQTRHRRMPSRFADWDPYAPYDPYAGARA